jgi:hypothetical protein
VAAGAAASAAVTVIASAVHKQQHAAKPMRENVWVENVCWLPAAAYTFSSSAPQQQPQQQQQQRRHTCRMLGLLVCLPEKHQNKHLLTWVSVLWVCLHMLEMGFVLAMHLSYSSCW